MEHDERLLLVSLGLLGGFLVAEVVVAIFAGSLALLADAGHLVTDAFAIAAAVLASRLARRPAQGHWTFGMARAEVLSAAVNGITLLMVAAVVLAEAIRRLIHPATVTGAAVVAVAAVGLAVNIVVAAVLARAQRRSMNIAGVAAHVVTDAYSFAATIVSGIVILATGWQRADSVASLVVVGLMLATAWRLLATSGRVLLEAAPDEVDIELVRSHLLAASHVIDVHDLHIWTVTSGLPALSVHVVVPDVCFAAGQAPQLLDELQACLAGHFDVEHSTFQLEPAGHSEHEVATHA